MGKASNRFYLQIIKDGQSISAVLMSTLTLTQVVDESGNCVPNWNYGETGAVNPIIYAYTRLNGVGKPAVAGSFTWSWNGTAITFDNNNKSSNVKDASNNPVFEKTTYTVGGLSYPALKIIRNLANAGNIDNDVISFSGSVEIDGTPQGFAVDTVVRITKSAGSGYYAIAGGDSYIDNRTSGQKGYTASVFAQLYYGSDVVHSGVSAKFYRVGIDSSPFATVSTASATETTSAMGTTIPQYSYVTTITEPQVTDRVVIRCDFYDSQNTFLASAYMDVDDQTDPEELFIVNSDGTDVGGQSVKLRSGQSVTIKAWMGISTSPYTRESSYNQFKCQLMGASGAVVKSGSPIPAGKTADSEGWFDITSNSVSVTDKNGTTLLASGKGGVIEISAADVIAYCDGELSGIITAEAVTNV